MSWSSAVVSVDGSNGTRTVTLSRAKHANALNRELVAALTREVRRAATDGVRLLVLRGSGRNFCGGFDLDQVEKETDASLLERFVEIEVLLQELHHAPYATAAIVHGAAVGAGADLVVACQYRIGLSGCRLSFPGTKFGLALGTRRLVATVGRSKAVDLGLSTRQVGSAEALAIGLLTNQPSDDLGVDSVIASIADHLNTIPVESIPTILGGLTSDSAAADMNTLVRSVVSSPLRSRILRYRGVGDPEPAVTSYPTSEEGDDDNNGN